ncbi:hypothetical protein [uncultured Gammaproteobacteria bacterium]|nr:hypothetical protein [uncultured Gammaproteobacteria bacterium]VVH58045.1 hypothetical protein BAZOLSSOX_2059 [uncultured Gammaproteobacteria bacterium]
MLPYIHHHTGGLEMIVKSFVISLLIHHHTGGLEITKEKEQLMR